VPICTPQSRHWGCSHIFRSRVRCNVGVMPVLRSSFRPPFYLRNPHVQTITAALLRTSHRVLFQQERLELDDGDFIDLRWLKHQNARLAILSHGLEGSAEQGYMRGMARTLGAGGWDALAWNFRGCGDEPNRLARFYHSGATDDLRSVIARAVAEYSKIALVGFSLGGNLTLKYLGEAPPHPTIVASVAVSAPVDLAASARVLDSRRANRIYLRRFIGTLVGKVEAKAARFPDEIDATGSRSLRTFAEFDDRYTGPLHGFRDAADYWKQSSARQFLPQIAVPTLLINALDDPFLAPECFPFDEATESRHFFLEAPTHGGHLGFLESLWRRPWHEQRALQFLASAIDGL
ncbi:MAG: alpha/beta fold hydrolase, partial [Verrucomicrobiota bacterium]|nr:alpha/beta fold hydrolase [Verrucomicrobiota bacterium]